MIRALLIAALSTAAGCGPRCDKTEWTGPYLTHLDETSGDCGPIPDKVTSLTNGTSPDQPGCVTDLERWWKDGCQVEGRTACTNTTTNQRAAGTGYTEQVGDDPAHLTATASITVTAMDTGVLICTSTYEGTLTRQ